MESEFYKGKKVLITGGLGFIGSNLAHKLVEMGAKVTLVDCLLIGHGGNLENIRDIREKVTFIGGDIRNNAVAYCVVKKQEVIFNLAGQVLHLDSMIDPFTDLKMNCEGQLTLLEACRLFNPMTKIVFASTRQLYGKPQYLPVDEKHPVNPVDINGIHKYTAEQYHRIYHEVSGIRSTILRLTNTYGPRMNMKHSGVGFAGWFIRQAIDNKEIQIFGDGLDLRNFAYVDDAVEAFLLAGESTKADGQIYNLGGEKRSIRAYAELLLKLCPGGSLKIAPCPPERKAIAIGNVWSSYDKITRDLGWKPCVDLHIGLTKTLEFFKENKAKYWDDH